MFLLNIDGYIFFDTRTIYITGVSHAMCYTCMILYLGSHINQSIKVGNREEEEEVLYSDKCIQWPPNSPLALPLIQQQKPALTLAT